MSPQKYEIHAFAIDFSQDEYKSSETQDEYKRSDLRMNIKEVKLKMNFKEVKLRRLLDRWLAQPGSSSSATGELQLFMET